MFRMLARATGMMLVIGCAATLSASGNAIGMAVANGSFQVDHSPVYGNSTLFDGSVVETTKAGSQLQLDGGFQMRLGAESRAMVFQKRLVLEQGMAEMDAANGFELEARTLHISAAPGSSARIKVENNRNVLVSAVRGNLRVSNAAGVLVARMAAGNNLVFDPQAAGASAPTRASGCLLEKSGKFILAERTTNIILELQGSELEKQVGNQIEISGKAETIDPIVPGASQVIKVAGVKLVTKGGCAATAKKLGAAAVMAGAGAGAAAAGTGAAAATTATAAGVGAATAGAATAAGIGVGTIAVIGGVATAATVGGLAAVGSLPGQSNPPPSASR
ncbi:MAG: hypothetical protein JWP63_3066 [Candidatus Solibacter sp.]|nr:hypothetical protein [Candidatus Solibacter sp.]